MALALGLSALIVRVALAHASLVRSDPSASATLAEAPKIVTVWFDEPIEPDYSHLEVYDLQGRRVDNLNTQYQSGDEPALTVSLPSLPQGTYVVVWRVISVGDAHAVGGAFSFGIGVPPEAADASAAGAQAETGPDLSAHLLRYLGLFAQAVLFGAVVFRSLIWQPVVTGAWRETVREAERRYLTVLADVLRAALIIGVLGTLYLQSRLAGVYFWQLFPTRWGLIWIARAVAAFLAAGWMEALLDNPRRVWLGLTLGAILLATTTLTSHSITKPGIAGPIADAVHLLATAVWGGGLLLLCVALISLRELEAEARLPLSAELVSRFSTIAAASVGLIVASGVWLGVTQIKTWAGLLLTAYGQTLLVKMLVVAAAFGFGVYNSLVTRRRLNAPSGGRAAWSVGGEAALAAGVIFVAAILTNLPPATAQNPQAADTALELSASAGELQASGRMRPARLGSNAIELKVTDAGGKPVRGAQIDLFFQPVGGDALSSRLNLSESAEGLYAATGSNLTRAGPWQILVTVQRADAETVYANFDLDVGPDGVARFAGDPLPVLVRVVGWLNRYGSAALTGLILIGVAGWGWIVWQSLTSLKRTPVWWLATGLLLAALIWFWIALRG